jgi:hypothetical protein
MTQPSEAFQGAPMMTPPTQEDDEVGVSKPGASTMTQPGQEVKIGAPMTTPPAHERSKRGAPTEGSKRGASIMASPCEEQIQGAITGRTCTNGSPQINPAEDRPMSQTFRHEPSNEEILIDVLWEHVLNERGLKIKKLVERNEIDLVFCPKPLSSADFLTPSKKTLSSCLEI